MDICPTLHVLLFRLVFYLRKSVVTELNFLMWNCPVHSARANKWILCPLLSSSIANLTTHNNVLKSRFAKNKTCEIYSVHSIRCIVMKPFPLFVLIKKISLYLLKPRYRFGKWWKWKISLMGFLNRVVWVLKALWIFLSETINFLRKLHKLCT